MVGNNALKGSKVEQNCCYDFSLKDLSASSGRRSPHDRRFPAVKAHTSQDTQDKKRNSN